MPELQGLTVATSYTPAEGAVAGDFFLVTPADGGSALVVVGDVIGHGLPAARRAAFVRATIALFAGYSGDPMTILRLANTAVAEREPGTEFVTALCAVFAADRKHGHVGDRGPSTALGPRSRPFSRRPRRR